MKILMVTDFYPPYVGGVERAVADLSAELSTRGHAVGVATLWHEGLAHREQDGMVTVHRLQGAMQHLPFLFTHTNQRFHPPIPDPVLTRQLRHLIAYERPDVVHGHSWMMHSVLPLKQEQRFAAVATLHDYALLCPKKTLLYQEEVPCPHQLSMHCVRCASMTYGVPKGLATTTGLSLGRTQYREVDAYVAVSSYVAHMHRESSVAAQTCLTTIPNFVRHGTVHAPVGERLAGLPDEYMLYVGILGAHKGVHVLLDAYADLHSELPLVLIGPVRPDTPSVLPPNVMVLPGLPHRDVIRAMDHCRFLVSPALWPEPFGLVTVEAMARGKAVIASRAGGVLDIVNDRETGLLVTPGDRQDLTAALRALIDDPAWAERMGRAGAARCAAHFVADAVIPRIVHVYHEAAAGATPRTTQGAWR